MNEPKHHGTEMAQSEIAQRVVDNTLLTAINRIGVPIFAGFIVIIVIPVCAWYLNSTATSIASIQSNATALTTRVTMVEDNQRNGLDRWAQVNASVQKLSDQQTAILEELAAINATLKQQVGQP